MATITLTAGANTKSWTISPADIQRILDAVSRGIQATNEDGTPRTLTPAECFEIIASRFITSLEEMTRTSERNATVIPDIVLT